MELGIRLSAVAGMVQKADTIADIGCDHGFVSIILIENHVANRMIACDINKGPLAHAEQNIKTCGLSDTIELRLSDGFEKITPGECDGAIIAGMGGPLGLRILYDGREVIRSMKQIVFQVQSKMPVVRFVLSEWGFIVSDEIMVSEDGKFYPVMSLVPPKNKEFYETETEDFDVFLAKEEAALKKLPSDDLCKFTYGEKLMESASPAMLIYLGKEEERLLGVVEKLEKNAEDNKERLAEIFEEIDTLMLAKWKVSGR